MKLINKKTVLTVIITMVLCFGISSFTNISKADFLDPTTHDHQNIGYDANYRSMVKRVGCEKPYEVTIFYACQDCGYIYDKDSITIASEEIAEHHYITFNNPIDNQTYSMCEYCGKTQLKESEPEAPTEPETDHVHNYNKKGKCKICGQMMP